jgi:hypothetical protein
VTAAPGRVVHYRLSKADVEAINRRREDAIAAAASRQASGYQVHVGNKVIEGDVVPAIIIRVWPDGVNAQAFLDGNDTLWLTSRAEGEGPGTWSWPPKV